MQNYLSNQTSPYLLQHADNPVNWYPWCEEAFARAKAEDKPVFLSIGYSTCHWCHVMAHESFEDKQIAEILNRYFISIKVDKEERPDIDSIYMSVCQVFTGSGGWPTTIFMTADQKPFYAGTYFPKTSRYGQVGLKDLLLLIWKKWKTDRMVLLESADEIISLLQKKVTNECNVEKELIPMAFRLYKRTFDAQLGGFGEAPKFPTPHNLLFLMRYYEKSKDKAALLMVEKTLCQMYRGGMFDHVGGGFSRYSTDKYYLVPHFEKMLYDNALLMIAYCKAYQLTKKQLYRKIAEKTAGYIMREMTSKEGGFYLYGEEHEQLIIRPKETYDGAVFSGNSAMAYNLVQLYYLTSEKRYEEYAKRQLAFMSAEAKHHPVGFSMFLIALSDFLEAPDKITIVWNGKENLTELPCRIPIDTIVRVLEKTTEEYPLKNGRTTFYVCKGHTCLPPENELML